MSHRSTIFEEKNGESSAYWRLTQSGTSIPRFNISPPIPSYHSSVHGKCFNGLFIHHSEAKPFEHQNVSTPLCRLLDNSVVVNVERMTPRKLEPDILTQWKNLRQFSDYIPFRKSTTRHCNNDHRSFSIALAERSFQRAQHCSPLKSTTSGRLDDGPCLAKRWEASQSRHF